MDEEQGIGPAAGFVLFLLGVWLLIRTVADQTVKDKSGHIVKLGFVDRILNLGGGSGAAGGAAPSVVSPKTELINVPQVHVGGVFSPINSATSAAVSAAGTFDHAINTVDSKIPGVSQLQKVLEGLPGIGGAFKP